MNANRMLVAASLIALAGVSAMPMVAAEDPPSLAQCVLMGGTPGESCGEGGTQFDDELAECQNAILNRPDLVEQECYTT